MTGAAVALAVPEDFEEELFLETGFGCGDCDCAAAEEQRASKATDKRAKKDSFMNTPRGSGFRLSVEMMIRVGWEGVEREGAVEIRKWYLNGRTGEERKSVRYKGTRVKK